MIIIYIIIINKQNDNNNNYNNRCSNLTNCFISALVCATSTLMLDSK